LSPVAAVITEPMTRLISKLPAERVIAANLNSTEHVIYRKLENIVAEIVN